ncbi:hypothetical protein PYCCODRAFT_1437003 [Trametes coccinea BRFM310]|uniref:Uncharacterized protein n=1 Tax=Trametes coccinea (strain BRFM310) TaxID=1353009 RepID=A0A1Y2IIE6_TRAC3|nr:hypothetical protein PYCCODRAFT_1437003 [Trametes coccinea BRFM310]
MDSVLSLPGHWRSVPIAQGQSDCNDRRRLKSLQAANEACTTIEIHHEYQLGFPVHPLAYATDQRRALPAASPRAEHAIANVSQRPDVLLEIRDMTDVLRAIDKSFSAESARQQLHTRYDSP